MLTEEKVKDIQAQKICTYKSLRCLAQETGILLGSVFTVTRLIIIQFCLYKIMYVHELIWQQFVFAACCWKMPLHSISVVYAISVH